jgi:hypothetical protein
METGPCLNIPPRPEECQTHDLTLCSSAIGQRSASHGSGLMNAASCRYGVSHSRSVDNVGSVRRASENPCGHEDGDQCIADECVQSQRLLHLLFSCRRPPPASRSRVAAALAAHAARLAEAQGERS